MRWVPIAKAQLRWQVEPAVDDSTQESSGFILSLSTHFCPFRNRIILLDVRCPQHAVTVILLMLNAEL